MHGYRDHCVRTDYQATSHYCPYSMYQVICPYGEYWRKAEEFPAHYMNHLQIPPPNYIPERPSLTGPYSSDLLIPCTDKFTYLWLKNGDAFWAYIVYIGIRAVSGWRYERNHWRQFGLQLSDIKNFKCP